MIMTLLIIIALSGVAHAQFERPGVSLEFMDGEFSFSVLGPVAGVRGATKSDIVRLSPFIPDVPAGASEWSVGTSTFRSYPYFDERFPDGAVELEVEFASRPPSDSIEFTIGASPGVSFIFQPALTPQEISEGVGRPYWAIGSYAVYSDKSGNQYKTGKLAHIPRPIAVDANGDSELCDIDISVPTMTVSCPGSWLDSAVYPVVVDPTFGSTTQGASTVTIKSTARAVVAATGVGVGNLQSITAWLNVDMAAKDMEAAIYAWTSNSDAGAKLEESASVTNVGIGANQEITFSGFTYALSDSTNYFLAVLSASGTGNGEVYFDAASGNDVNSAMTPFTWEDPFTEDGSGTRLLSIYGTEGSGGSIPIFQRHYLTMRGNEN